MSGIKDRIEDALFLWDTGRHESAFLMALIAVSAVSRQTYPKMKDRQAFVQFLTEADSVRISVEYRGEIQTMEHILYKWLRCQLVHEGAIPVDIQFVLDEEQGAMSVRAGGAPEFILKLGTGWFHHLIAVAMKPLKSRADGL